MSKYTWPLAINTFGFLDRLRICKFFLTPSNRWTQDKYIREYEKRVAEFVGCKYAVAVSSGSTANQLIAQFVKDKQGDSFESRNQVIVNAVTWQTNVSPFVREGFVPVFLDVNLQDFCLDYDKLEKYLKKHRNSVSIVFPTSVLGFTPDMAKLKELQARYPDVYFAMDCCENFLSTYGLYENNICSFFTSSTSGYIAHQISNGQEFGFIFTNSEEEYQYFILSRAHGLVRNLLAYGIDTKSFLNNLVDPQFDFHTLSSNYRNTDIGAYLGLLDFEKIDSNIEHRKQIYNLFYELLDKEKYHLPPPNSWANNIAFCLPIIIKGENADDRIIAVKDYLDSKLIERRSFVSGNMLRQLPYQQYGNYKKFKNAEYLNKCGMYIGLHKDINKQSVKNLCFDLNLI